MEVGGEAVGKWGADLMGSGGPCKDFVLRSIGNGRSMTCFISEVAWSDLDFIVTEQRMGWMGKGTKGSQVSLEVVQLWMTTWQPMWGWEGMASRNMLDESEFVHEWMLEDDKKVEGVKDDTQVSHNKSSSLPREHSRKPNVITGYAKSLRIKCCSLLPHPSSLTLRSCFTESHQYPWNLALLLQSFF